MRFLSVLLAAFVGSAVALPWGPLTSAEDMAYFKGLPTEKCQWIAGQTVTFQFKWRRTPLLQWWSAVSWELDGHLLSAIGNPDLDDVKVSEAGPDGFHTVTATLPEHRILRSSDGYTLRAEYKVTGINIIESPKIYVTDTDEACPTKVAIPTSTPVPAINEASDSELNGTGA
ncbi:uncharacterized protein EV422DRAFT_529652 [Fimicolochytrium jonesii]|uniref:uncharacterized protein n=1 Tax=Fimicolochytrium jonesii TaxID=1396493 RepID=UPI0022FDBA1E|nr:uncharacterized protein EV422DRAFT_529652 [Fimicolochytrium jonesii]KAI8820664.1 hypothetical protein EV422DRAFT_529652 [Fimicolochytrium jonesii]